ncbi:MAG TPA: NRDE family protein [Candidatus Deferrimicrobium sp.]|nr:NRDE family protein [Candidatus Deferrimicrobium sp.]
MALYFNVFADLPLLVAANRDEHFDRPSAPPAEIAGDPRIVAGRDLRVGGTWLGVNEYGVLVGILNRRQNENGSDGLLPTLTRSRGLLCMDLLQRTSAAEGAQFIAGHSTAYNPFTVVFADRQSAWVAYNNHDSKIVSRRLDPGLHVFSSAAELDLNSAKADRAHPRFAHLKDRIPIGRAEPATWLSDLHAVLGDHTLREGSIDPGDAICVHRETTGTVSSSVVALAAVRSRFDTFFCPGPPCQNSFTGPVSLAIR